MPTNRTVITIITSTLAVLAVICVTTICVLAWNETKIPPELNTLTATLVGIVGSMLVKTSPTGTTPTAPDSPPNGTVPTPVTVVNEATDPVPTEEQK